MKKKLLTFSLCTLLLALAIFVFSYFLYHYMGADGHWVREWQPAPGKPFITHLFAEWGVMFLFSSVISALSAAIFFTDKKVI